MENVSKALMIAGGILIAIIVLSLLVFGYGRIRSYQDNKDKTKKLEQVTEYNKKFDSYNKNVVKGYEIISLANLAYDTNKKYSEEEGFTEVKVGAKLVKQTPTANPKFAVSSGKTIKKISIKKYESYTDMVNYIAETDSKGKSIFDSLTSNEKKEFKDLYFECDEITYDNAGRVVGLYFTQILKK